MFISSAKSEILRRPLSEAPGRSRLQVYGAAAQVTCKNRPIAERASNDGSFRVGGAKLEGVFQVSLHRPVVQSVSWKVVPMRDRFPV
jgi:hypothetical protein